MVVFAFLGLYAALDIQAQTYTNTITLQPSYIGQVVRYKNTSNGYSYTSNTLYNIGRYDGTNGINNTSAEDIYRTGYSFDLASSGIPSKDSITSVTATVSIYNYANGSCKAKVVSISSSQSFLDIGSLWSNMGTATAYFDDLDYGINYKDYTSSSLTSAVKNDFSSGHFNIGIISKNEGANLTYAYTSIYLKITYKVAAPKKTIAVKNSFPGGSVIVDGTRYDNIGSGKSFDWTVGSTHTITAIDNQYAVDVDGQYYYHLYRSWSDGAGNTVVSSPQLTYTLTVSGDNTYTANFLRQCNISFQNNFVGVGNGGVINVNGTQYNSPTSSFTVTQNNTITAQAIYTTNNGIEYLFNHWEDGSTSNPYTFTASFHATHTAYFIGKPLPMINYGLHHVVNVGQNIHLVWNDHPNTNVTQYQIWRKVKHSLTGIMEGPTLLTTLNRGTTSWTDYDYIYTSGYTDDLLSYDVRAYYRTEGTYANESWVVGYGKQYDIAQDNSGASATVSFLPKEYSVVNYPNPFNPSTTIRFALPKDSHVVLKVYDMLGREMMTLVDGEREAGYHEVKVDGTRLGSGVYLYRITAGEFTSVKKMLLTK